MSVSPTKMAEEIREIPEAVERLLTHGQDAVQTAATAATHLDPRLHLSVARGSSDHVCTFLKYVSELLLRRPMASVGPSVKSIYGTDLLSQGALCLAVSQSGRSPDIVGMTRSLRAGGGLTVAITNEVASPLAEAAEITLPLHAGPEVSVAATKTFVTSMVAGLWLLAEIKKCCDLNNAIRALPDLLAQAIDCDWSAAAVAITGQSAYVIGRGPSWAVANEAALKFKETCLIHAESYSSAELLHGPVSIVDAGFPVIAFAAADAAETSVVDVADTLAKRGASVFVTSAQAGTAQVLPHIRTAHWLTDPIATIVSFYAMVEAVARARGIDPDRPRHLQKVTETV